MYKAMKTLISKRCGSPHAVGGSTGGDRRAAGGKGGYAGRTGNSGGDAG